MKTQIVSKQTQRNWLVLIGLVGSAVAAGISGLYFLFIPSGGYQGGRNPYYNLQLIFKRDTWDDIHTWGGILMILIAVIHLVLHWSWFMNMIRRIWNEARGMVKQMNKNTRINLILDIIIAISFFLTAFSGIYFFFAPDGHNVNDPIVIFSKTTWDLIHTWAGVALMVAALIHIAIHRRWITKVSGKMVKLANSIKPVSQTDSIMN
jgi:hypothetical protein